VRVQGVQGSHGLSLPTTPLHGVALQTSVSTDPEPHTDRPCGHTRLRLRWPPPQLWPQEPQAAQRDQLGPEQSGLGWEHSFTWQRFRPFLHESTCKHGTLTSMKAPMQARYLVTQGRVRLTEPGPQEVEH
jgi:hypothetical protein